MASPRTGATATSKDGQDLCRAYFFPCMKERDKRGSARRVLISLVKSLLRPYLAVLYCVISQKAVLVLYFMLINISDLLFALWLNNCHF